jgi:hypothetical protein
LFCTAEKAYKRCPGVIHKVQHCVILIFTHFIYGLKKAFEAVFPVNSEYIPQIRAIFQNRFVRRKSEKIYLCIRINLFYFSGDMCGENNISGLI